MSKEIEKKKRIEAQKWLQNLERESPNEDLNDRGRCCTKSWFNQCYYSWPEW
jgi:hypothetical protein